MNQAVLNRAGFKNRANLTTGDAALADLLGSSYGTSAGVNVTVGNATQIPAVFACQRVISETVASLPKCVYKRLPDGNREEARDHPVYSLLAQEPNPGMTPFDYFDMTTAGVVLSGNSISLIVRDNGGSIVALHPFKTGTVECRRENGQTIYICRGENGQGEAFRADEILHVRSTTRDGLWGISPITECRESFAGAKAVEQYGHAFYGNSARPSGVLVVPTKFKTQEERQQFLRAWESTHRGAAASGKTATLEGGITWQSIGLSNEDAQFLETRRFTIGEIARIFRVQPHMIQDLSRCMPASTLVFTEFGPKRISDIVVGDKVWTPSVDGLVLNRVTNHWSNGERELLEIRTTNRTLRCTSNHRLLVRREKLRDLLPKETGGKNVDGKKQRVEWINEYVEAGKLRIGDTIITLNSIPDDGATVAPNRRNLTVGFMEFAGLLMADGNILYEKGKPRGVQIARGENVSYMSAYRSIIMREFKKSGPRDCKKSCSTFSVLLRDGVRQTVFSSTSAARELFSLGLNGTAFTKRVPGWVFTLNCELRLAFLRGFLDGDGTVDIKGRITFYSANPKLLDDIRHLCMSCGIPVTNSRSDRNGKKAFCPKSGIPTLIFRFTCSDPGANSRIGSHDTRYVKRFSKAKPFGRKDRAYPRFGGKNFKSNGLSLARISSVLVVPPEQTYDIEVEGEHCFIADGVVSHNSTNNNIEHQGIEFVTYTIRPWLVRWEQALNRALFTPQERGEYYIEFNVDGLLRGDFATRMAGYSTAFQNSIMSPNEIRRKENMNSAPGGDEFFRPLNMTNNNGANKPNATV